MTNLTESASLPSNYRPAKPLPFELVQHTGIFFEEKLYTQALNLLLNILASSAVADTPTFIPSPQHLAVAATLLVHPSTTTRAKTAEEEEAPSVSLQLLRLTNSLVGPVAADFGSAFVFTHFDSSRRGRQRRAEDEHSTDGNIKPLNLDLGQSASIWSRAEDFWHAVGWAFNCSVRHRERWAAWQLWLEFMCELLEADWSERVNLQRLRDETASEDAATTSTGNTRKKKNSDKQILKESMIFRYISEGAGGYGQHRRILRAIFADGGAGAVSEFREVFHNELKQLKRDKQNVKKREIEVNIDEEQYGDYLTDDDDEDDDDNNTTNDDPSETSTSTPAEPASNRPGRQTKRPRRGTRPSKDPSAKDDAVAAALSLAAAYALDDASLLGGLPALALRQRLLHLLSEVSENLPDAFIGLEKLYHLFVENIRHLPLPVFQAFVSPAVLPHFSPAAQTTLCEVLLFRMRESAAPDTDELYLTQAKLEHCFLPYAASTPSIADNTKVSIALEALLILLADNDMLKITPQLREAVEAGVLNRVDRVQVETKKSLANRQKEDVEWSWLLESGDRLMYLVNDLLG
ncbi:hypothetical protein ABOM_004423 [Aspergillus terreus]|uniref:Uncharacterized protein n=1 Tax=Aspergillus terreus TaxID=33178 RepID=A0A5M3YYS6_ASPTE|nr:hypothetical protein ATETN484_0005043500 [Aspergillus terreus]GFF17100.1 hypothetical protein ABOM_004423 [Aspergillus terreus]